VRMLRPLRLLIPVIAVGGALVVFLVFGFLAYQGSGGGPALFPGICDAGLRSASGAPGGGVEQTSADLTPEQRQNAATIIGVARNMGAPPRAWLVALATAKQESDLLNINYGDRDSLGLFQQRPSQGWGSPAQVLDPVYSTTTFLDHLLKVPNWDRLPVTVAAQTVQRSAFPDAYAKWEALAADLVAKLAGVADPAGCGPDSASLPEGVVRTATQFALAELGKPYVWGATGPDTFDCSGLILRAFQAAGIDLPRVSRDQFDAGGHVPVRQAQAGDLLFYATDPTDPATIHHVALYLGGDQMVEAPYSGEAVRMRPVPWGYPELVPLATRPGTSPNSARA
jgi:peptidoglycan DL-endopeptidase CwlO